MTTGTQARSYEDNVEALAEGLQALEATLAGLSEEEWARPTLLNLRTIRSMDEYRNEPPFGILLGGMIIGLAIGTIAAKHDHFVLIITGSNNVHRVTM